MFYFPIIDKIINWMKEQGKLFWGYVLTTGVIGAVALDIQIDHGFTHARILWVITGTWWIIGALVYGYHEGKRNKKEE